MGTLDIAELRKRVIAKRDVLIAATHECDRKLKAIDMVAAMSTGDIAPHTTAASELMGSQTLSSRIRTAISEIDVDTFSTKTILRAIFPHEEPSKSQRSNVSGTLKRIVEESSDLKIVKLGRGKRPTAYQKSPEGGDL